MQRFIKYYNHPLNHPICPQNNPCTISIDQLKKAFCDCSKNSRLLGQNSFAMTKSGQCYGNHFLHKISKPSILSNEFCTRHDERTCKRSDRICLGGRDTVFIYSNA
ncbi:hypothetical protein HZS_7808 [Henneguya salminicola]|nr:hypothetical protein HZS_7808 [Henneguya salminicola]